MAKKLISACLLGIECRYDGKSELNEQLLKNADSFIPICPEQLAGLPTPRPPAEIKGDRVVSKEGVDLTSAYQKGAQEALKMAKLYHCKEAILKSHSPMCGCGEIYDGSFSNKLVKGDGILTQVLKKNGILVKSSK